MEEYQLPELPEGTSAIPFVESPIFEPTAAPRLPSNDAHDFTAGPVEPPATDDFVPSPVMPPAPAVINAPSVDDEDWVGANAAAPAAPLQQQSPMSPPSAGGIDDMFAANPEATSPAPVEVEPPTNEAKYAAVTEALRKQITSRTAAMDASTKEKEAKIVAAAKEYIKKEQSKREQHLQTARASHKKEQLDGEKRIDEYKKSGAMWNAVGILVDLNKPNSYSKGTERMRTLLTTLNEKQKETVK